LELKGASPELIRRLKLKLEIENKEKFIEDTNEEINNIIQDIMGVERVTPLDFFLHDITQLPKTAEKAKLSIALFGDPEELAIHFISVFGENWISGLSEKLFGVEFDNQFIRAASRSSANFLNIMPPIEATLPAYKEYIDLIDKAAMTGIAISKEFQKSYVEALDDATSKIEEFERRQRELSNLLLDAPAPDAPSMPGFEPGVVMELSTEELDAYHEEMIKLSRTLELLEALKTSLMIIVDELGLNIDVETETVKRSSEEAIIHNDLITGKILLLADLNKMYERTKQGQIDQINAQILSIELLRLEVPLTQHLIDLLDDLIAKREKLAASLKPAIDEELTLIEKLTLSWEGYTETIDGVEVKHAGMEEQLNMLSNSLGGFSSAYSDMVNTNLQNELTSLKKGDAYQKASRKQRLAMEEAVNAKHRDSINKAAQMTKAVGIFEAAINIYSAVIRSFTVDPTGILAVAVGILGSAQLGMMMATPVPKFQEGGYVGGRRHSQGGTMIEAERGEFIMSRRAVESIGLDAMNRINQGGGSSNITVNVSGNVMTQEFVETDLAEAIREAARRGTEFGMS